MNKNKVNFFDHPTKQQLIISGVIWLLGFVYLLNKATHSFSSNPFDKKNSVPIMFLFAITIFIAKLWNNYIVKGRK
ncbi:hypothetical protein GTQ40_06470 [Flavobacteriaceae bacterium R38]|nr:hypothetical protein [Flavobacteriaceae bacterium R38]